MLASMVQPGEQSACHEETYQMSPKSNATTGSIVSKLIADPIVQAVATTSRTLLQPVLMSWTDDMLIALIQVLSSQLFDSCAPMAA